MSSINKQSLILNQSIIFIGNDLIYVLNAVDLVD